MPRFPFLALLLLLTTSSHAAAGECVVLLHGLGRSAGSMAAMEEGLRAAGYATANVDYPSREHTIGELAGIAVDAGITRCREQRATKIHFVTHSLGGILVRTWFQQRPAADAHRVVMLGPPNHGSEIIDRYRDTWWLQLMTGKAGRELGTDAGSLPNRLAPIPLETGIIAGTVSSDPWFSATIAGADDGKVSTASARLEGMRDYIEVAHGHTFMMRADDVIAQTVAFLASGRFRHDAEGATGGNASR